MESESDHSVLKSLALMQADIQSLRDDYVLANKRYESSRASAGKALDSAKRAAQAAEETLSAS
jgi:hypothetical protein